MCSFYEIVNQKAKLTSPQCLSIGGSRYNLNLKFEKKPSFLHKRLASIQSTSELITKKDDLWKGSFNFIKIINFFVKNLDGALRDLCLSFGSIWEQSILRGCEICLLVHFSNSRLKYPLAWTSDNIYRGSNTGIFEILNDDSN